MKTWCIRFGAIVLGGGLLAVEALATDPMVENILKKHRDNLAKIEKVYRQKVKEVNQQAVRDQGTNKRTQKGGLRQRRKAVRAGLRRKS